MSILIPATLTRTLPLRTFDAICQLLQQMAQVPGALLLRENAVATTEIAAQLPQRFAIFISEKFSALLWAKEEVQSTRYALDSEDPKSEIQSPIISNTLLKVGLTFEPEAIASFGYQLCDIHTALGQKLIAQIDISAIRIVLPNIKSNDAALQSEFTLQLLEIISWECCVNSSQYASLCKSVEDSCHPQLEQERLLNQVTTQIRDSLELPVILLTAVEQLRQFLEVDRLLIYQFDCRQKTTENIENKLNGKRAVKDYSKKLLGRVNYEALANEKITSVLYLTEGSDCFPDVPNYQDKYRKGITTGITDIETAYISYPCFLEFMRSCQVRAKLVVPIIVQEELWGLLIAHQCFEVREWEESKKTFLIQIAEHLAIAIYQAELYAELQQQKHTLEQRVIERTQELQDALAAAQSASLAKTEFLATMSHELRTPLTCVIGISATLLRWSCGNEANTKIPPAKQKNYLQSIHDSGKKLLELIEDILDLSQVEAGNTVLKISEFSLPQIAYLTVGDLKEQAAAKQIVIAIEQHIEPGYERFAGDQRRIKQILFNLLTNAIKFTPSGGRVTLRVWVQGENAMSELHKNSIKSTGNIAVFQVEDTGIGIAKEQQSLLFQKFKQLDSPYRREYSGIGLGLALTKQLVELHGGVIEVKSTVGVGSIFTAFIPVQNIKKNDEIATRKAEKTDSLFIPQSSALQGCLVVIEDNEEIAALICDIMTAAGLQVVWMIEGSTAVEQIELFQPIAVIVDMRLPGTDGYEIIHQLRKISAPYAQCLKILALTSKTMLSDQKAAINAGADDYLSKPVQPQELLYKITNLLRTNS
ncbi:GAF domain-containing hybrid sensor histidine kinase/response regulator [Kamptonema sp. UHCC 0994]|uniref:hybrid sensor histidine kinase/response regulator n=1 Tax=Kamptonema sp. UHCC 0994 TaxID=3031329 RepID=UPI0023B9AC4D|nr:GAF domain-containing hybrid sensor histidine kinase/response regulator [Kamptonema sp. UHCC 0994]MDF0553936.1 ATP-binding protein [Kamptonema sp. UHCC 0994]